jgi:hypothetical protein
MADETEKPAESLGVGAHAIIDALDKLTAGIAQLHDRQEEPAPGILRVIGRTVTTLRLRVVTWVVAATVGAVTSVQLVVGAGVAATVDLSPETPTLFTPLPITIESGTDIISTGATFDESYLIYYPDKGGQS